MIINNIKINNEGCVHCKSEFYSAYDVLSCSSSCVFSQGINTLIGDIDSGIFAVSYLLSMYKHNPKDFIKLESTKVEVNGLPMPLEDFCEYSCYMDRLAYPLFSSKKTIKTLINEALKHSNINVTSDDIEKMFDLDTERINRPIKCVGNEKFRAMAAIGYAYGKEVFCFPWMSQKRFKYYNQNLSGTIKKLESLNKIVIVPVGIGEK